MDLNSKIFIAGHKGMVGSACYRLLTKEGHTNLLTVDKATLNFLDYQGVSEFFAKNKPEYVIIGAAKVGGIQANLDKPADYLYENLVIQNNIIHNCYLNGVKKLAFLGSSCIYPKETPQPMKEEYLLSGKLEPTNEGYSLAKISGIKLVENYNKQYGLNGISLMPCNMYGPNDNFDPRTSHVLSAVVKKLCDAVKNSTDVEFWGTGIALREFMHVDDFAAAIVHLLKTYDSPEIVNIGWGEEISIKDLVELVAKKVSFKGKIIWDSTKPNGMLKKCMDVSKMKQLGFTPKITLNEGIDQMIELYKSMQK